MQVKCRDNNPNSNSSKIIQTLEQKKKKRKEGALEGGTEAVTSIFSSCKLLSQQTGFHECMSGTGWEPIKKMSSYAICHGMPGHNHLSSLSHYRLILA